MSHDIHSIWNLTDQNEFVIAMMDYLCEKSRYGDEIDRLSTPEQVFYICTELEQEVNNGGFDQFFYNSSGNFSNRIVECFIAIGADETADICKTALAAFSSPLPVNRDERQTYLDEAVTDEISDILSACDDRFYDYPDDLETLSYQYIMKNKAYFS